MGVDESERGPRGGSTRPDASHRRAGLRAVGPARRLDPAYSRRVRSLRVILPVLAVALVALVVAWPHLQKENIAFTIGFATSEIDGSQSTVMVNPRYTGTDGSDRPYSITADLAHNLVFDTDQVDLDNPKADITLADGTWLVVTAESGVYARAGEILDLSGSVNMFQDEGYEIRTEAVRVNLENSTAESVTPTEGHGPFGELRSEGFRIVDLGRTIVFTGNARLTLFATIFGDDR